MSLSTSGALTSGLVFISVDDGNVFVAAVFVGAGLATPSTSKDVEGVVGLAAALRREPTATSVYLKLLSAVHMVRLLDILRANL